MSRPNISGIPDTGEEHYFDLVNDPNEMTNLASEPFGRDQTECWRSILINPLQNRPGSFTDGHQLQVLGQPT